MTLPLTPSPVEGEKTAHTPGPWIFYADLPSTDPNWHIVTTANKLRVLANVHIEPDNPMDEANARLIAAAPDLLEAMRGIEHFSDAVNFRSDPLSVALRQWIDAGREAIARAEGRAARKGGA